MSKSAATGGISRKSRRSGSPQWVEAEVQRYLRSGDHDARFAGWPGETFLEVSKQAAQRLRTALVEETRRRAEGIACRVRLPDDLHAWTRHKLAPMVSGLFAADERAEVLDTLERSVAFLTPQNFANVLLEERWLSTVWDLANLYLHSLGLPGLSEDAPHIVGLSQETTCYVSMSYFQEDDPFADFVVHEAGHVFHNCKRAAIGLAATRRREWLLDIDYAKRETFAYACEAFSRINSMGDSVAQRQQALARHAASSLPPDDRVDHGEYLGILGDAVRARNGWQCILKRCAPARTPRPRATTAP